MMVRSWDSREVAEIIVRFLCQGQERDVSTLPLSGQELPLDTTPECTTLIVTPRLELPPSTVTFGVPKSY